MSQAKTCTVTLYNSVTIDGTEYSEVNLRKPGPGDLRGKLSLDDLGSDISTTSKIIERCSFSPNIPASVVLKMEMEDVLVLATGFASFFEGIDPMARVNMKKMENNAPNGSTPKIAQKKQPS